jgi:hypothetical protein
LPRDYLREGDAEGIGHPPASPLRGHADSADGAAIAAIADWLHESADETTTAALIQHFQGTAHEAALTAAQGEIMHLGEDFDVQSDFMGLLRNIRRDAIESEMSALLAKGLGGMSQAERERHEQLKQSLQQLKTQIC